MIKLFLISVILLHNYSESIKMGHHRPLLWKGCGKNTTLIKHQIVLRSNCIKSMEQNKRIVIDDNRILSNFPSLKTKSRSGAGLHEAPFAVTITYATTDMNYTCSGSIIGDQWILTSGVCARGPPRAISGGVPKFKIYVVYYGTAQINSEQTASVDRTFLKNEFNPLDTTTFEHNIGVLRLDRKLRQEADYYNRVYHINTVCLPELYDYNRLVNESAVEYGWTTVGSNTPTKAGTRRLLRSEHIVQNCDNPVPRSLRLICSLSKNTDCPTDAGGPLVVYNEEGRAIQIGVSVSTSSKCEDRNFIDVRRHLNWVKRIARNNRK